MERDHENLIRTSELSDFERKRPITFLKYVIELKNHVTRIEFMNDLFREFFTYHKDDPRLDELREEFNRHKGLDRYNDGDLW